ncbi:serine/threonine-protein kinase [Nonomuraea sp. NPDC050404]|uniref:serine/threonine-protein kinase n=1 Tax=Nonomuraea sp. NPDC050404 TaxID=3155783 RepID=UPI0033EF2E4F
MSDISVPGYEIKGVLGQGGFGVVYLAVQSSVGREVALKVDNRVLLSDRDKRRFLREVTAAGALSGHPHVVPVYDAGLLPDGRPYMVLELCPNGSLSRRILSPAEARDVGVRIADALAAAHAQGVLHRDVKPANILINRYGQVALSDFGLATMPESGPDASVTRESLTPSYAPPEAFELAEPSPAGDVYALAATVYALLSGRPPRFPESGVPNVAMILALHRLPVPDLPGVPPELTAVLRHALASDPRQRMPSAAALRDALAAIPISPSAPAMAAPPPFVAPSVPSFPGLASEPSTGPSSRAHGVNRILVAIIAVLSLVIVAGGTYTYTQVIQRPPQTTTNTTPQAAPSNATGTPPAEKKPSVFAGLDTYTDGCPAAGKDAGAACPRKAECWGGLVIIVGDVKAQPLSCGKRHSFETFAVASMPKDKETWVQGDLARHRSVQRVCSRAVLASSRNKAGERIAADNWTIAVMPPSQAQFENGARYYRCIARATNLTASQSYFR